LISIQTAMLVALGFLVASLLGLLVASAFWTRAVRLTTERIKRSMPVSEPEIKADRDRLRAEYAIKVHKLERQLDQTKLERARQFIEINRRDASIATLESDVVQLRADLDENLNARRVLEQTVADRLPKVEARLAEAKRLLFNRDREIADLSHGARRHKEALEEAASVNAQQSAQIDRLTTALTTRGGRSRGGAGDRRDGEVALRSEIEALRTKAREQATLIDRLQRRLGHGYMLPNVVKAANGADSGEGDIDRLKRDLSQAEAALRSARAANVEGGSVEASFETEIRGLRAKADDQAGEIARLKSALVTFEQGDSKPSGLKDSKIALKARLGSAQAQADQQAATISRLRAELASAHERLARQAAHFMEEMRRIGSGTLPAAGQPRTAGRPLERRSLAERVAQVSPAQPAEKAGTAAPSRSPDPERPDAAHANGHKRADGAEPAAKPKAEAPAAAPSAAEMPKAEQIPAQRRRLRLLDRITGTAKS
jgi:chromosome segregation ATPase